jgi:hypothetical protein
MSAPKDTTYPAAAKKATWNKAQSAGDKIDPRTKNTGLGKALESAEFWWTRIPFDTFVADPAKLTDYTKAGKALANAEQALASDVASAKKQVAAALALATQVKSNKALSASAKTAAANAETALKNLNARFAKFGLKDLEALRAQHKDAYDQAQLKDRNLKDISVYLSGKEIGTATSGTWNNKVLKSAAFRWTGLAANYVGKTVKVEARFTDDGATFQSNLKVKTASNAKTELDAV